MRKKVSNRILVLLLSLMMIVGVLPMNVFAAGNAPAQDAVVTLTVSNKGVLATANDGSIMANRDVTVKDINSDGNLTFDEALVAAHGVYNSESGYSLDSRGSYVTKLWGVETSNSLFFVNDVGLTEGVTSDTVKAGDRLVASINADDKYYGDWYAAFDKGSATAAVGEDVTLTLKGHLGMSGGEAVTDTGLSGISVGVMTESGFKALDGKVTDDGGKVTVSFDTAGTYYVTASGTVEDTVTNWSMINMSGDPDSPAYGIMDYTTYETSMAYTDKDYGDGPYPADEVKLVDFSTWKENQGNYHTLRSNQLIADCPIIAPVCVVTVAAGSNPAQDAVVTLTVSNKGVLAAANDGSIMANRKVTVKDINSDGYFTFDEALVAAHAVYNSESGYSLDSRGSYVTKLWGVETSNCLFFINDAGLTEGVTSDIVKAGDRLVASINADDKYYGDWYAAFDKGSATAAVGEDVTLTLKGHLGMSGGEAVTDTGLSGISVGVMTESGFKALDGKVTDDGGKVTVSFDTAGTYYVTASGTVEDTVTDWYMMNMSTPDNPAYGIMDYTTYETSMAYTDKDYGDGPYPADEVKLVDFSTWKENQGSYHTLRSNQLIADCPIIAPVCVVTVGKAGSTVNFDEVYKDTGDYLTSPSVPGVGSIGSEWVVIGLARGDREVSDEYYDSVVKFVSENINEKEQIDASKSTENSKVILALTSLGYDVTDVGGHNLLQGLTDMNYVKKQGINGPIWALIAFDSHDYEVPKAAEGADQLTCEKLVSYILQAQLNDGGWDLRGNEADPDMTGMALQALAPYYDSNSEVKAAVDKALDCLSAIQQPDGGYMSMGVVNAESCAQVVVALTALGIDPDNDERFIKNDCSVLDALLTFAVPEGGFKHTATSSLANSVATEQGNYALVAYDRFRNGKTSLYDMSDVKIGTNPAVSVPDNKDNIQNDANKTGNSETPKTGDNSHVALWFMVSLCSLAALIVLGRKKKSVK